MLQPARHGAHACLDAATSPSGLTTTLVNLGDATSQQVSDHTREHLARASFLDPNLAQVSALIMKDETTSSLSPIPCSYICHMLYTPCALHHEPTIPPFHHTQRSPAQRLSLGLIVVWRYDVMLNLRCKRLGSSTHNPATIVVKKEPEPTLKNAGKNCWNGCGNRQGKCDWCGSAGMCCRYGWSDRSNGCNGQIGIRGTGHVCAADPAGSAGPTQTTREPKVVPTANPTNAAADKDTLTGVLLFHMAAMVPLCTTRAGRV